MSSNVKKDATNVFNFEEHIVVTPFCAQELNSQSRVQNTLISIHELNLVHVYARKILYSLTPVEARPSVERYMGLVIRKVRTGI